MVPNLSAPSLSSSSWSFSGLTLRGPFLSCAESSRHGCSTPCRWVLMGVEGKNHLPWPTGHSSFGAAQVWVVGTHSCFMPSFSSTTTPSSPLQDCAPWVLPVCAHVWCCPNSGTARSFWMASLAFVVYSSTQLCVISTLAEGALDLTLCVFNKGIKIYQSPELSSHSDKWGTPLVTGLYLEIEPLTTTR